MNQHIVPRKSTITRGKGGGGETDKEACAPSRNFCFGTERNLIQNEHAPRRETFDLSVAFIVCGVLVSRKVEEIPYRTLRQTAGVPSRLDVSKEEALCGLQASRERGRVLYLGRRVGLGERVEPHPGLRMIRVM